MNAWFSKLSASRLGVLGWAGIGLLLLALAAQIFLVLPRVDSRREMEARAQSAPRQARAPNALALDADSRLADFQRELPRIAAVPEWLGRIHAAAQANGLVLRSGDYKLERSAEAPYLRYRITVPVRGSYRQIRGFVGAVLADVPAASVDDVQLKKETGAGGTLEARLRLSLFIAPE
jgi:Tfp pilus assembly protein PilO